MKQLFFLTSILFTCLQSSIAQKIHPDSIALIFDEIKIATKNHTKLWNTNLYGPLLFVAPQTRELFANEPDTAGILKPNGAIYSGLLPNDINIANTAIDWGGKRWAMLMLPLPQDKQTRIKLLAHELFHRAQPALGFTLNNADNKHLDQKEGRIYLRLELEALKAALEASSEKEIHQHILHALTFRKYRQELYAGSHTTENLLELNEGIAEFTGLLVSYNTKEGTSKSLVNGIHAFYKNPTFVRSFAYYTIPVYGYLLYQKDKNWHNKINDNTDLTAYFSTAFGLKTSNDFAKQAERLLDSYGGRNIIAEETVREENTKKLIAAYTTKFIEQPHFELKFEKMNFSFDPRNIVPLADKGTVYPNMRVSDLWGILTVENGALMHPNWDKLTITNPTRITEQQVTGDGWTLELAKGYALVEDRINGNYKLVKKAIEN